MKFNEYTRLTFTFCITACIPRKTCSCLAHNVVDGVLHVRDLDAVWARWQLV